MNIKPFDHASIAPLSKFGLNHPFFNIHISTLVYTWIAMALLICGGLIARCYLQKKLHPIGISLEVIIKFFINLCSETIGFFKYEYFAFIASLFLFTLYCNMVGLLPFIDEATKDLNTALALGVSSFFYVQYQSIKKNGLVGYLKDYVEPVAFLLPLEIIGKVASIVSMSFRLFGNILGGSIVYILLVQAVSSFQVPFLIFSYAALCLYFIIKKVINLKEHKAVSYIFFTCFFIIFFLTGAQIFFGVFGGFVQAFVITMLTVTYLAVAVAEPVQKEKKTKESNS